MDPLISYSIPVKGLRNGIHQFDFQIDRSFFQHFENSPIAEGDIQLGLEFDKRQDMYVLHFHFSGTVETECDRCLAPISLPISGQQRLLVKLSEEEATDEADVVFISPETQKLNVAQYIYEYICLSLPLIKVYDCQEESVLPCNEEMLAYLDQENGEQMTSEEQEEEPNPIWDELKKLSKKN